MGLGREPPHFVASPVPRSARRVAYAPVPVSQISIETASDLRVVCECVVCCVRIADHRRTHCTFDIDSISEFGLRRPSHDQPGGVLDVVKALAVLDPAGCGLDGASAQLGGRTYVMAGKSSSSLLRPHFCVDPAHRWSYREDLAGAIVTLRSPDGRGALQPTLSELRLQLLQRPVD
jgi:hypothetical protein